MGLRLDETLFIGVNVNEAELNELIANCPALFHVGEGGSWSAIKELGLLSTTALMDLYNVPVAKRIEIEKQHRSISIPITAEGLIGAVIRDQKPMSDAGLRKALPKDLLPSDWFTLLNNKVFFWLSPERLHKLTSAKAYRDREHDVLEIDTRSLIDSHRGRIWLCPINSGCTKPFPHPRDVSIFSRISDYPYNHWRQRRSKTERVVELAVDYSVPDIAIHVRRVVSMRGQKIVSILDA